MRMPRHLRTLLAVFLALGAQLIAIAGAVGATGGADWPRSVLRF